MDTYKRLLFWLTTTCVSVVMGAVQAGVDPRTDRVVVAYAATFAVAGIVYAVAQLYATVRTRERKTEGHDALVDSALKDILRQKLVSEHDRLMDIGSANDSQRSSWQASYETYESLCDVTGDSNGVIDVYRENVMSLPSDKKGRAK